MGGSLIQVTTPDGTIHKEYAKGYGWEKGLSQFTEEWPVEVVQGVPQNVMRKWVGYIWTQDDTSLAFAKNPRMAQTIVSDSDGNQRQLTYEYNGGYGLATTVREWGKVNGQMVQLRRTVTGYNLDSAYLNSRVIGLPCECRSSTGATNSSQSSNTSTTGAAGTWRTSPV